jgi:Nucleotidyl transferase AbiEii toxin, Type IV TA system
MKDFYDITFLANNYKIDKDILKEAIVATFKNRGTNLDLRKNIFSDKFINDEQKQKYWAAFLNRHKLKAEKDFSNVVIQIKNFIEPLFKK